MTTLFSPCKFTAFEGAEISVGNEVQLNGTTITSKRKVTIGNKTMIAQNVIIVDSDFHKLWPPEDRWLPDTDGQDSEVLIGDNVWIGMNTVVLKGSRIGNNAVIGACSVVRGEIPENALAAGNPARVIRMLDES